MSKAGKLFLLAGMLGLAACSGFAPPPTPTSTIPPPTPTATATIVWFPPTDTPTPFPTATVVATTEQRPGLGDLLFRDSFDQPALWNTAISAFASAAVTRNRLVLSINGEGPATLASLRSEPALGDFYAEATASLSLCQGDDEFGMIFRAAPGNNYYRFTLNCRGQLRLERSRGGLMEPLQDWFLTGDAPQGAPADVRLGIWAFGNEMRFFLNGNYQLSVRDPILHTGTLGFFVFASGASPVTAAFSDLAVYQVTYVSPTPSLVPTATPRPSATPKP